jgi:hypothetical protein
MDATQEQIMAKIETNQERMNESLEKKLNLAKRKRNPQLVPSKRTWDAWIVNMRDDRKETMACLETMEVCLDSKKPNLEEMLSEAEHQEVLKEHATVETGKVPNKRHRGQNLAAAHRQKSKERTQGNCGSQKKLVTARRRMTHCAAVARLKGNIFRKIRTQGNCGSWKELATAGRKITRHAGVAGRKGYRRKGQSKDNVVQETQKEQMFRKRLQEKPEGSHGIRDQEFEEKLRLGSERTSGGIYRKTIRLEIVK